MFKISRGLVPAIPPESYLTKVNANKRTIKPTQHKDFRSQNIITRQARNHDQCFIVPQAHTEIFKNCFINKTIIEWNNLNQNVVIANSVNGFKSALEKSYATD